MIAMASLRRSLSSQIRDSRATASGKASSPLAASLGGRALSQAQVLLLWPLRVVAMAESCARGATKLSSWKKLLIQFGICFAVGLLLGWFTPQKWQSFVPDSLAVKGKTAEADLFGRSVGANALTETKTASSLGAKATDVISVDEVSGGIPFFWCKNPRLCVSAAHISNAMNASKLTFSFPGAT